MDREEWQTRETPQLQDVELVSDGWIKKYVLTYRMPDGTAYTYESVSRKGREDYLKELRHEPGEGSNTDAVSIVPITDKGEIVLIREFRYPLNSWCIAFPAGLLEGDESLLSCVDRELAEETGYRVRTVGGQPAMDPLSQPGYSSTGMSEESVQVVYASVEMAGQARPEPSEFIEAFLLPIADVPRFLAENTLPIGTRCQLILESFMQEARWKRFIC